MLIYILHNDTLNTFNLPKEVSGSCFIQDYDSNFNLKNLINAYAQDGKWYIKANSLVKIILNNQYVDSCELVLNTFVFLQTHTNEPIILYPTLTYNDNYIIKEIVNEDTLIVGKNSACDIVFQSPIISDKQFQLTYHSGKWYAKNLVNNIPLYCNNTKIEEGYVDNFDTLFIMGFKIVVCGKLLFISNINKNIYSLSSKVVDKSNLNYEVATIDTSNQAVNDFYSPDDYFSKSPIFVKKINTLSLDVASPKPKEKGSSGSFLMNMVPTVLMSSTSLLSAFFAIKDYNSGKVTDKESLLSTILMCVVILIVSIIWPFVERLGEKIGLFIRNTENSIKYRLYIKKVRKILTEASATQKMALIFNNLSLKECYDAIKKRNSNLFSITADQNRFLNVRLGIGRVRLDADINFSISSGYEGKDNLEKLGESTIKDFEYIEGAPYSFSLKDSISFININGDFSKYYESIILQLIAFNDYYNLKIVVLTSEGSKLNLIRNLNHCWNEDKTLRYFATTTQEAEIVSGQLIRILNSRKEGKTSTVSEKNNMTPHYIIITDNIVKYRNTAIIGKILESSEYLGFSVLLFAKKLSDIPNGCKYFLEYTNKEATLFESEMNDDTISRFTPEFITDDIDFVDAVREVSNIPVISNIDSSGSGNLPDKFGFLEMFNVGNVEQLNSITRWKTSSVINTLATPLGIDPNGSLLNLDLHEKAHGPHGLIAGMTGSGKSETIVSYILSLSVNYSPNEVQFVLIDYKGGGLAGAFENRKTGLKLPHLVGTITNLDKSSMNRTLVSIKSELQRRQRVFNEAKEVLDIATIDIYKYQDLVRNGSLKEPMAHLFIICDEFAELKAQQPDFMDELVSAARIGRSLGIHLILATQKPSGVVDEQIWSNSKFKICAKVQTAEDSQEMIRKPDAAYIKESGRFYLQVGYDEIFVKAQSAYTGVKYVPSESVHVSSGGASSIFFVDNLGNATKTIKIEEKKVELTEDLGDELGNVTKYLIKCSKALGIDNRQLWLDNVPNDLYLSDLIKKYQYAERKGIINPIFGEYDDPSSQKQGPVSVNISEKGSLWVCGMTGSGKTTLMSTLIYSTIVNHSTNEVNIFIVDFLTETLRMFSKAPQVADVITSSEHEKINKIFYFLKNEVERRKKVLAMSGKSFLSSIEKGENIFPTLLVFINGYDVFYDSYYDLLDEVFSPLLRDSGRVGIHFVLSSTSGLTSKLEANFPQKLALRFNEATDYLVVFENATSILPTDTPGRGLIDFGDIYEFQVAQMFHEEELENNLKYVIDKLCSLFPKAKGIPVMPKVVSYENMRNEIVSLDSVPIGFETISNCVCSYDFNNLVNLVLYSEPSHAQGFQVPLIRVLQKIENIKIIWIDSLDVSVEIDGLRRYSSSFGNLCSSLYNSIIEKKSSDATTEKVIFIISGYGKLEKYLKKSKNENESVKTIDDLIVAAIGSENYKFILFESADTKSIDDREWIDYYDYDRGILLARDPEEQEIFNVDSSSSSDVKYNRDIATVINQCLATTIKYMRK